MVIVVAGLRRRKGQSLRSFLWRLVHKFSIFAPITVASAYGIILGIVAQADRGTDAREFFDNQIVMWRAIVLAPYGIYWFIGLLLVWLLVVLWTGQKAEHAEKVPAARPIVPRLKTATDALIEAKHESNRSAIAELSKGDRNASLAHALGWAVHAEWDRPVGSILTIMIPPIDLEEPIETLREAALEGKLRVWGRREPHSLFELIHRGFWEDNTIHEASLKSPLNHTSTIPFEGVESTLRFYDIRLNKAEVERVWPHAG